MPELYQCPRCPGKFLTLVPGSHVCAARLWPRRTKVFRRGLADLQDPKTAQELYKAFGRHDEKDATSR